MLVSLGASLNKANKGSPLTSEIYGVRTIIIPRHPAYALSSRPGRIPKNPICAGRKTPMQKETDSSQ